MGAASLPTAATLSSISIDDRCEGTECRGPQCIPGLVWLDICHTGKSDSGQVGESQVLSYSVCARHQGDFIPEFLRMRMLSPESRNTCQEWRGGEDIIPVEDVGAKCTARI